MHAARDTDPALERLRALCLTLPETTEKDAWGHPNFRAGKRTFVAFEWLKGVPSIAFRLPPETIDALLQRKGFFLSPYGRGLWVSLWVSNRMSWRLVTELVRESYRTVALKRMLQALDPRDDAA